MIKTMAENMMSKKSLRDGEPCDHPGCLQHVSHPCEGCGRIAGIASVVISQVFYKKILKVLKQLHDESSMLPDGSYFNSGPMMEPSEQTVLEASAY